MIQTVLGEIEKEDLGYCHSHEHLFLAKGHAATLNPFLCINKFDKTVEEVELFKSYGGRSIVDAQPLGSGRMEIDLVECSQQTGIHVIASTGFHKLEFYPKGHWVYHYDERSLKSIFIHDLTAGMFVMTDDEEPSHYIDAKAGLIKTAIDDDRLRDPDKKWFRAAAAAALETGAPIMCHTESKEQALEVISWYESYGVPCEQVILCHLDRTLDGIEVHQQLAEKGVYLEYDTIGRFKYHSDEQEAQFIKAMIDSGYGDRLLLGLDTTRERLKSYGADIGLDHMASSFLPLLQTYGVTDQQIEQMMVHNPAQAFSFRTK